VYWETRAAASFVHVPVLIARVFIHWQELGGLTRLDNRYASG
jgi:hypothetical protein